MGSGFDPSEQRLKKPASAPSRKSSEFASIKELGEDIQSEKSEARKVTNQKRERGRNSTNEDRGRLE